MNSKPSIIGTIVVPAAFDVIADGSVVTIHTDSLTIELDRRVAERVAQVVRDEQQREANVASLGWAS